MGDSETTPLAPISLDEEQLRDIARLLARSMTRGNIAWLATASLGPEAVQQAGNEIGDVETFALKVVRALDDAGRIPNAVALLRQEAHHNSRLTLGLNHIMNGNALGDGAALQALLNDYEPFLSAAEMQELLPRLFRTVCAVALGEPYKTIVGSGFLIGPDLVMTNYHVVVDFLAMDLKTKVISATAPGDQLFFFFDYLWAPAPSVPPDNSMRTYAYVTAADKWLVHARELLWKDGQPGASTTVTSEYDYVVIRLRKPIGALPARRSGGAIRGWLSLPKDAIDYLPKRRVLVFQHPERAPQQFDIGDYVQLDPSLTRARYAVNTAHGSSGGAAVGINGELFALHNAEVTAPVPGASGAQMKLNQGVRIDKIADDLRAAMPNLLSNLAAGTKDPLFWSLNDSLEDSRPIIGRTRFREMVEEMCAPDGSRVLVVTGPPASGLRYSVKLLRRTLGTHVPVIVLSPRDLQNLPPEQFIRVLVEELGVGVGVTAIPEQQSNENVPRWIRNDLPRWLLDRLSDAEQRDRARFPAWVVINAVVPEDQRLLWAQNLRDLVASLVGAHDPGQAGIDLPQLRWMFLSASAEALPLSGVSKLDEDLSNYVAYEEDFAECLQTAWLAIDKQAGALDTAIFRGMARVIKDLNPAGVPLRKALANGVCEIIRRGA